ncbi:MAG: TetR/AcrR family transcriptional regulator C-terminal domain-containing protein, partial [Chloroflexota bacterium]
FLALLDSTADRLRERAQVEIAKRTDPISKVDVALEVVLNSFASHRALARLFLIEALGAGREFHERLVTIRKSFAGLIQEQLDEAVRVGAINPIDTKVAAMVWFGALNEVVTRWVLEDESRPLKNSYPALRALLLRSIGAQMDDTEAAL